MPTSDREAQRKYFKSWYEKNKKREIARVRKNKVRRFQELDKWVAELKAVPCKDCGRRYPPIAMDFDHVRGKKVLSICLLVRQGYSVETIRAEILKCEVVCACCHRIRTLMRKQKATLGYSSTVERPPLERDVEGSSPSAPALGQKVVAASSEARL